jgi:hypothetical protein
MPHRSLIVRANALLLLPLRPHHADPAQDSTMNPLASTPLRRPKTTRMLSAIVALLVSCSFALAAHAQGPGSANHTHHKIILQHHAQGPGGRRAADKKIILQHHHH